MSHFYFPRKSLAAIPASILLLCTAFWAPPVEAKALRVTNCGDSGAGSLREAVAVANSGDLITLKQLTCARIVLGRQIEIPQASLTLVGNGKLTVDGDGNSRVFRHYGTGTLRIESLAVASGFVRAVGVAGGCIRSDGRVELRHARVHHCIAVLPVGLANWSFYGGGIAATSVLVSHSKVFSNSCDRDSQCSGGGIYGSGPVRIFRSEIYDNRAGEGGGVFGVEVSVAYSHIHGNRAGRGGAIIGTWDSIINASTISGNRAGRDAAIALYGNSRLLIMDSTISGNVAAEERSVGWVPPDTTISNSTIAFNHVESPNLCLGALRAPRVRASRLHLESSIISNNSCAAGRDYDIGGQLNHTVFGANNIIGRSILPLPADTISTDPRLRQLADNGGPTPTHALRRGSPAINAGNNVFDLRYDQRGPGFPRIRGLRPDIGAIEYCGRVGPHDHRGERKGRSQHRHVTNWGQHSTAQVSGMK